MKEDYIRIKFPCGCEIEIPERNEILGECPLHGKKCPPSKEKKK